MRKLKRYFVKTQTNENKNKKMHIFRANFEPLCIDMKKKCKYGKTMQPF